MENLEFVQNSKIKFKVSFFFIILLLLIIGLFVLDIYAEEKGINKIKDVRFGIHDGYTRVVFDLEQSTSYKVIPDTNNKLITLMFLDLGLNDGHRSEKFSDSRIKGVYLHELPSRNVKADIILQHKDNLFFYFELKDPPRVVIDIREKKIPPLKPVREESESSDKGQGLREKVKPITQKSAKTVDQKKAEVVLPRLSEEIKDEERSFYRNCIKLFQEKKYGEALSGFQSFMDRYKESRFAEDVAFLIGDSYYNIARKTGEYLPAIKAYKSAMRRYSDSDKIDLALYRMGRSYREIKLFLEAKASYQEILDRHPKGKFATRAQLNKADILLEEKKFKMAYRELKKIVSLYPLSRIAGEATFKIADSLYKSNDFISAELIYEEANKRWPTYPKSHPEVMLNMGQTYLKNGRLGRARNIFFVLINLYPDSDIGRKALMMIGDIYRTEGMEEESLKVYSEAILRGSDSDEAYYGKIRMADVGIEKPDIKITDIVFDYSHYLRPMDTYEEIAESKTSDLTAGEALLRKGIALAKKKRYTEAIQVFRDVATRYPDTPFSKEGISSLQKTFYKLVETYHSQDGFLPVLLTYHKNLEPYLRDITDVKSLFQIGESYQKIGLYDAAIDRYKKAMTLDLKGVYREQLVFKIGESYLLQDKYTDAERVLKEFLKRFSKSRYLPHVRLSLGNTFYRQARFKEASSEYRTLINTYPKDSKISEIYYYLGNSYNKLNKFDMAIDAYNKSISSFTSTLRGKKAPSYILDSYFEIGDCLYKDKKYPAAIEAFQRAIKLYPDDERYTWALYLIGDSYRRLKKKDNAIAIFSDIVKDFKGELIGEIADRDIKSIKWEEKYKEYF